MCIMQDNTVQDNMNCTAANECLEDLDLNAIYPYIRKPALGLLHAIEYAWTKHSEIMRTHNAICCGLLYNPCSNPVDL